MAAPAVAKVASLLPAVEAARIRSLNYLTLTQITRESVIMLLNSNMFLENISNQYDNEFSKIYPSKTGSQLRIRLPTYYKATDG